MGRMLCKLAAISLTANIGLAYSEQKSDPLLVTDVITDEQHKEVNEMEKSSDTR